MNHNALAVMNHNTLAAVFVMLAAVGCSSNGGSAAGTSGTGAADAASEVGVPTDGASAGPGNPWSGFGGGEATSADAAGPGSGAAGTAGTGSGAGGSSGLGGLGADSGSSIGGLGADSGSSAGSNTAGGGSGGAASDAGAAGGAGGAGNTTDDIGTWIDAPGACPSGMPKVDVASESDLENATRGEGTHETDPASVCYLIHNGTYRQNGGTVAMYITRGGTDAAHRRVFVGESRSGVILRSRASIESGANHVQISNLTFDLSDLSLSGSFNTLTLNEGSSDLRIDHVSFTGDCRTGANGGHVEVDGSSDVVVEACVVEKFGRCGPDGHQDHGIYLASGSGIAIRNNDIRGNASRGILFNTQGGSYGTLDTVTIEKNRIHQNGHADYEDGIAMNATDTGTISNVTIQRNLIYGNYYSGIRVVGDAYGNVVIRNNTFSRNGVGSSASGRSELNLDDTGSGAETTVTRNVIVAANRILNNCYDARDRHYTLTDNVVQGTVPAGDSGNCISGSISVDPAFVDASNADFRTGNASVYEYGAYAP